MIPALDFIIMQNRMYRPEGGSIRRITEVAEVVGMEEGNVQLNRVFEWNNVADKVEYVGIASQTLRDIAELRGIGITEIEEEIEKRRLVLEYMDIIANIPAAKTASNGTLFSSRSLLAHRSEMINATANMTK